MQGRWSPMISQERETNMTYRPHYDRSAWRMCDDIALIEAAADSGHELALVLGERLAELAEAQEQLEAMTNERDELDARCDVWKQEAIEAQDELAAIDAALDGRAAAQ